MVNSSVTLGVRSMVGGSYIREHKESEGCGVAIRSRRVIINFSVSHFRTLIRYAIALACIYRARSLSNHMLTGRSVERTSKMSTEQYIGIL